MAEFGFSPCPRTREVLEQMLKESHHLFQMLRNDKACELIAEQLSCPSILVDSIFLAIQNEIDISGNPITGTLFPKAPKDERWKGEVSEDNEDSLRRHIRAADHKPDQNSIDRVVSNFDMPPDVTERIRFIVVQFLLNVIDGHNKELPAMFPAGCILPLIEGKALEDLADSFATCVDDFLQALASSFEADAAKHEYIARWLQYLGNAIESGELGNTPVEWLKDWRWLGKMSLRDGFILARPRIALASLASSLPIDKELELSSNAEPPTDAMSLYCLNEDYHYWKDIEYDPKCTRSKAFYEYEQDIWNAMDKKAREPFERLHDEDFARCIYQKYIVSKDGIFDDGASREWQHAIRFDDGASRKWKHAIRVKATEIPRPKVSLDAGTSDRYEEFLAQEREEEQRKKEFSLCMR